MSIRLRLTLLYTTIVALTLAVFATAVYTLTARVTLDATQQTLIADAQRLADRPLFDPAHVDGPERGVAAAPTYIQIRYPDGALAAKTANLGANEFPISDAALQTCRQGESWLEQTSTENGRLLVYNRPVIIHGQYVGIVQVARSLADYDQSLDTLARLLIIGSVAAAGVVFAVGWLLAGAALRPIQHITETAQAIGAERDFGRRVEYAGPRDEVNWLARTFNTMLGELQSAYRQMEDALQAQRRFAADASHELRTPLTTIRGNLGLLQREPPIAPEDRVAVVTDMVDETERLMRLVNSLLLLARADAHQPLRREPVPLTPLLDDVCRQALLLAPGRTITRAAPENLAALGDRDALKQVLLALLDNALKYTPENAPIEIEALAGTGAVALRVRDHGPGIPAEALPHIFERFYRADTARTSGGAGLGLSIAHALVTAQGGTITVESRPGEGSTFTVELPQAAVTDEQVKG
jgi:two-component system OmpR family sensor kinase